MKDINVSSRSKTKVKFFEGGFFKKEEFIIGLLWVLVEYNNEMRTIKQTLKLIKKGKISGYDNLHTLPRIK